MNITSNPLAFGLVCAAAFAVVWGLMWIGRRSLRITRWEIYPATDDQGVEGIQVDQRAITPDHLTWDDAAAINVALMHGSFGMQVRGKQARTLQAWLDNTTTIGATRTTT